MTSPRPDITVQEAADAATAGEVLLVDVREDDEWAAGHAPGAVHIPLAALTVADVPVGRPVVAVCRSGNRSARAAALLAQSGVDVANMAGGMAAWAAAGLPVVTLDGGSGTVA